jgi:hypothetical protein
MQSDFLQQQCVLLELLDKQRDKNGRYEQQCQTLGQAKQSFSALCKE